jgi:hypothetical protein
MFVTLFVALNPLVFLLPVESGERIGLSMTILLSYTIFLTLISDAIPASSNPMSITLIVMMHILYRGRIIRSNNIADDLTKQKRQFKYPKN